MRHWIVVITLAEVPSAVLALECVGKTTTMFSWWSFFFPAQWKIYRRISRFAIGNILVYGEFNVG